MSPLQPPYATTPLLTNFHGRWFNSVNDVIVHSDGSIWFTDPDYGFEQNIRPRPQLPNQVYRYDPGNGDVRAVATGLGKPNGLCFSPDEKTLYVTDTDAIHGEGPVEPSRASSMCVYFFLPHHIDAFPIVIFEADQSVECTFALNTDSHTTSYTDIPSPS